MLVVPMFRDVISLTWEGTGFTYEITHRVIHTDFCTERQMDGGQQWARVRSDGGRGDKRVIHNIIWMCLKSARNVYIRDRNVYPLIYTHISLI